MGTGTFLATFFRTRSHFRSLAPSLARRRSLHLSLCDALLQLCIIYSFFEPDLVLFFWKKISLQFYFYFFPSPGASPLLVVVVIVLGCVCVFVL
jgi:hypothetical protein